MIFFISIHFYKLNKKDLIQLNNSELNDLLNYCEKMISYVNHSKARKGWIEKKRKIHPATKSFQAFRIFINDELNQLKDALEQASRIVKKNGIIVVISFHSLEDNIVKNFFRPNIRNYPKDIPLNSIEKKEFKCIAKKIRPSDNEININKRSRSAIMRVFRKI